MIDLHIHSRFSDGTDTIDDLLKIAKNKSLPDLTLTLKTVSFKNY